MSVKNLIAKSRYSIYFARLSCGPEIQAAIEKNKAAKDW